MPTNKTAVAVGRLLFSVGALGMLASARVAMNDGVIWRVLLGAWISIAAVHIARAETSEAYVKSEHMVEMRDGVKLYTVVHTPTDRSQDYPVLLLRTQYSTDAWIDNPMTQSFGPSQTFDREKYIYVHQDVRGRFRSEGDYSLFDPKLGEDGLPVGTGDSTDAYDTVAWILRAVEGHNGRVGMWGISAGGWTTVMGMINAHPALVAFSPQAPVGDLFIGDDAFHNGAFHLNYMFRFLGTALQPGDDAQRAALARYQNAPWDYKYFADLGPVKRIEDELFKGTVSAWSSIISHPTYDSYWRARNVPQYLKKIDRPALFVAGWFDAEDFYGTIENYKAVERYNPETNKSTIVIGPWEHGGWYHMDGDTLGDANFGRKTSLDYREHLFRPFMLSHLKDDGRFVPPEVVAFNTGDNRWLQFDRWPAKTAKTREFFFEAAGVLATEKPKERRRDAYDSYVSDPAKPVPHTAEIRKGEGSTWIVEDQRFAYSRPDVLSYMTEPLDEDLTIAGRVVVNLHVSTSGSDSDWVVKLIDVYPEVAAQDDDSDAQKLSGRQQLVAGEIMRGRFRDNLSKPKPMKPNSPTPVAFFLPDRLHTFKKGHRIMVQVQSSWFPMFDMNPQTYVDVFEADADDYQRATQRIYRSTRHASHIRLPVIAEGEKRAWVSE